MKLIHDGEGIDIQLHESNLQEVTGVARMGRRVVAETGANPREAAGRLLRRISTVMVDAGRPMLSVREVTLAIDQLLHAA